MQVILNAWDMRLAGIGAAQPQGREVFKCDESTPLHLLTSWIARKGKEYDSSFTRVRLLCHGTHLGWGELTGSGNDEGMLFGEGEAWTEGNGGAGLMMCAEGITLDKLHFFRVCRDRVDQIDILGCGAAFITPGCEGQNGDGNLLCYRLAQITKARVRASTASQSYDTQTIDHGGWEGTVLTYGPDGRVIAVENNPIDMFWSDPNTQI